MSINTINPYFNRAISNDKIHKIIEWLFIALIFFIPLEAMDMGNISIFSTPSKAVGYLLFAFIMIRPSSYFRYRPSALIFFGLYLLILTLVSLVFNYPEVGKVLLWSFSILQLLVFVWIVYNIILRKPQLFLYILFVLGISTLVSSLIQFSQYEYTLGKTVPLRMTFYDLDPNNTGANYALGSLALIGFLIYNRFKVSIQTILALSALPIILYALIQTASRGAMLAFIGGAICFLFSTGRWYKRILYFILVGSVVIFFIQLILNNDVVRKRWESTLYKSEISNREYIFPLAYRMFIEKPILGWGQWNNEKVLGYRFGSSVVGTHSIVLTIFTQVGLIGGIPFFIGIWMAIHYGWLARIGRFNMLPFALLIAVLLVNLSINWVNRKQLWLLIAIALATGTLMTIQRKKNKVIISNEISGN